MNLQEKLLSLLNDKDYKSDLRLYCKDCKYEFPQVGTTSQSLKETEKRNKVINITEIKNE